LGTGVFFYTSKDLDFLETQSGVVAEGLFRERYALASFSAAARYFPNVRRVRMTAYLACSVEAFVGRMKAEEAPLKEVDSGPNVVILEPSDDSVFVRAQRPLDRAATSPVQTYLDLMQESLRGPEAAEALVSKVFEGAHG
jgi:Transcriptional regulator, AbiEi antitoxin, Type IV TA system